MPLLNAALHVRNAPAPPAKDDRMAKQIANTNALHRPRDIDLQSPNYLVARREHPTRTTFCSRPGLTKQGTDKEKRSKTDRPRSRINVSTPNHSTKKIGKMLPLRQATEISSQAT